MSMIMIMIDILDKRDRRLNLLSEARKPQHFLCIKVCNLKNMVSIFIVYKCLPAPVGGISASIELQISLYGVERVGVDVNRYLK